MMDGSKLLALVRERDFWAQLLPDLSIGDASAYDHLPPWPLPFRDEAGFRAEIDREGYAQLPHVIEPRVRERLSAGVRRVAGLGIPPVFCMVFDLFWTPAFRLSSIVNAALGANHALLPALWIWHLDPAQAESGWRPHRDVGHEALFSDGRPKAVTTWLALCDATPQNGCMYVVPAHCDPTYGTADDVNHALALPAGRALPADAGDVILWNQALLHWGGQASPQATSPRISMSFEFMREGIEPYSRPVVELATVRRFEDRLHLIAKQILRYRHMYGIPPQLEALARAL